MKRMYHFFMAVVVLAGAIPQPNFYVTAAEYEEGREIIEDVEKGTPSDMGANEEEELEEREEIRREDNAEQGAKGEGFLETVMQEVPETDQFVIEEGQELTLTLMRKEYIEQGAGMQIVFAADLPPVRIQNKGKTLSIQYQLLHKEEIIQQGKTAVSVDMPQVMLSFSIYEAGQYELRLFANAVCWKEEAAQLQEVVLQTSCSVAAAGAKSYLFSGQESVEIAKDMTKTDVITENGTQYIRHFTATLHGFHAKGVQKGQALEVFYQVLQGENIVAGGSVHFTQEETKNLSVPFYQAGEYRIVAWADGYELLNQEYSRVTGKKLGETTDYIDKRPQQMVLTGTQFCLKYGESISLEDKADNPDVEGEQNYPGEWRMEELSEDENKQQAILELKGNRIRAVGVNTEQGGFAKVRVWREETQFYEASAPVEIMVEVHKVTPRVSLTLNTPSVSLYDTLTATVFVSADQESYQDLLAQEERLSVTYRLTAPNGMKKSFENMILPKGEHKTHSLEKRVNPLDFLFFKKNTMYKLEAEIGYQGAYSPYETKTLVETISLEACMAVLYPEIEMEGRFSYREDYARLVDLQMQIKKRSPLQEEKITMSERQDIMYTVSSDQEGVIALQNPQERYTACDERIPLEIKGVGTATLTLLAQGGDIYQIEDKKLSISVDNSGLTNQDLSISYTNQEGIKTEYSQNISGLTYFLQQQNQWVNGELAIEISPEGRQYYNQLSYEHMNQSGQIGQKHTSGKLLWAQEQEVAEYEIWLEHTDRNASTRLAQAGSIRLDIGVDKTCPQIQAYTYSTHCYEPASSDKIWYFSSDFKLTGTYCDNASGIDKIQYSLNADQGEDAKWHDVSVDMTRGDSLVNFEVYLGHGRYTGIAVRAIDVAGNSSEVTPVMNDQGNYVIVVVDGTEPILHIKGYTKEQEEYTGNWTNQPVRFQVTKETADNFLCGIYEYQYQFVKIGEEYQEDEEQLWKNFSQKQGLSIGAEAGEQMVNQNGTYYFRAITNAGVVTAISHQKETAKKIRLQQKMADRKDIIETGAGENPQNEWYNKASGVPVVTFSYPEYDAGIVSAQYEAPITVYTRLTVEREGREQESILQTARIGMENDEMYQRIRKANYPISYAEEIDKLMLTFGYSKTTGYAEDGIYTLEYWICDDAGNESRHETKVYKVDTHEPTSLSIYLEGEEIESGQSQSLHYDKFYQHTVNANATADYGISGKGYLKLMQVKEIGQWNQSVSAGDSLSIEPSTRCFLYAIAEDQAGNQTKAWTMGIVVDNELPRGELGTGFTVLPKGANRNGFYREDVEITIAVADSPDNDNYAALADIVCTIGNGSEVTADQKQLFSVQNGQPTKEELTASKTFQTVEVINAAMNEGNEAFVEVTATDRSGNQKTTVELLKIDVTKPVIDISFDHSNMLNGIYAKEERTAIIRITELNFDINGVTVEITKDGEKYDLPVENWQQEGIEHTTKLTFQEDGDYRMSVGCTDLADNEAEVIEIEPFTLDRTKPELKISYSSEKPYKDNYYNQQRVAQIQITEHNFREEDFILRAEPNLSMSSWSHEGDIHTAIIRFTQDARYLFSCEYTDLAGNALEQSQPEEFYIDTQKPVIQITGIEDGSANAGEIAPVIIIQEENFNAAGVEIRVTTGRGEIIAVSKLPSVMSTGCRYDLPDMNRQKDDIYHLQVKAVDMAGNASELTCRFSLNRNGSTYDLSQVAGILEKGFHQYSDIQDMVVMEMNVDIVEELSVYISENGNIRPTKEIQNRQQLSQDSIGYQVERTGNEAIGYTYQYTFYRENFQREGSYHLICYSKDRAGNHMNNTLKEKNAEIRFIIDNTMPTVIIDGLKTGGLYKATSQTAHFMVRDNFRLKEAEFILLNENGDRLKSWDYCNMTAEGEIMGVTVPSYEGKQSLTFRAVDAAGNEAVAAGDALLEIRDFLITTNEWLHFIHSPKQMAATAGVAAAMLGGSIYACQRRKKKKRKGRRLSFTGILFML